MKCYYEELGVERTASESEIKSAYRKLALRWHPDKNPECINEAKNRFQIIQQAYDVLSDHQERAWYDTHREQILRGKNSNYEDNCLDVFQYFTVSCFKGYGDDSNGFYAIYKEVFLKIAAEDVEFIDCEEQLLNIPTFGDSKSGYEETVGPFYAHWSAYCTKRTYTWLCPYDIKEIKDRKILREIEKDMKKMVQKAKKERNDEVRNLVSFVRKRDKRVQANKRILEDRAAFNRQKQEQNRLEQIKRRQKELDEMRQNSHTANENDDYEEQLKQLELQYSSDDEYYKEEELVEQSNFEDHGLIEDFYCVACNKDFKTERAFANHEISKKHRDNIERLKVEMQEEQYLYQELNVSKNGSEIELTLPGVIKEMSTLESNVHNATIAANSNPRKINKKKEAKKMKQQSTLLNFDIDISEENMEEEKNDVFDNNVKEDEEWHSTTKKLNKKTKNKNKSALHVQHFGNTEIKPESSTNIGSKAVALEAEIIQHVCATCKSKFESKNKLFSHLKLTDHGIFMPKTKVTNDENLKCKKIKAKKK